MVQLPDEHCAKNLLELAHHCRLMGHPPYFLVLWFCHFDLDDFDKRLCLPRFPVTLSFLGLHVELRD